MSRRTLLSAEQRVRLFGIPTDPAEMAKHYVLSPQDLKFIEAKRRSGNLGSLFSFACCGTRGKAWALASIRRSQ